MSGVTGDDLPDANLFEAVVEADGEAVEVEAEAVGLLDAYLVASSDRD